MQPDLACFDEDCGHECTALGTPWQVRGDCHGLVPTESEAGLTGLRPSQRKPS